mgnify:CR=1 FL=1
MRIGQIRDIMRVVRGQNRVILRNYMVVGGDYHKPFEWRGRKFSSFPSDHAAVLVTYEIVPEGGLVNRP